MDPAILIILLFIVAPLLERLLKGKKGDQPPGPRPGQRPGWPPQQQQRLPPDRPGVPQSRAEPGRVSQTGARTEEESAAAMLPDDLWEILTGERRPPPPTRPPADDEYEPFADDVEDEILAEELSQEDVRAAEAESMSWRRSEPAPWDDPPVPSAPRDQGPVRSAPYGSPPVPSRPVPAPIEARAPYVREMPTFDVPQVVSLERLTFDDEERHDQFHERLEGLAPAARVRRQPRSFAAEDFSTREMRRAIIMAEVLGPPKGLE